MIFGQTSELERCVSFYSRTDFRGAFGVDVEAAVGKLAGENRADRLIDQRASGRIPQAVLRRMTPEFQENEIGFKGGIGREIGPPITLFMLQIQHVADGAPGGLGATRCQRIGYLDAWTHILETVCN